MGISLNENRMMREAIGDLTAKLSDKAIENLADKSDANLEAVCAAVTDSLEVITLEVALTQTIREAWDKALAAVDRCNNAAVPAGRWQKQANGTEGYCTLPDPVGTYNNPAPLCRRCCEEPAAEDEAYCQGCLNAANYCPNCDGPGDGHWGLCRKCEAALA